MRGSPCRRASLLLQHIHQSLPVLQRLYAAPQTLQGAREGDAAIHATQHAPLPPPPLKPLTAASSSSQGFPPDPHDKAQGDAVVSFFCEELGIGEAPLRLWRQRLAQRVQQRWRVDGGEANGDRQPSAGESPLLPWTPVRTAVARSSNSSASSAMHPSSAAATQQRAALSPSTLWLRPRPQDAAVVRSAIRDLRFLVSPLLLLSPPPYVGPLDSRGATSRAPPPPSPGQETQHQQQLRPTTYEECSRWYATQPIPAGMFLMSIPTQAVLFADPPPASDPLLTFFMQVEELVAQLVDAAATDQAAHHGYVTYLCNSVVPCRNLPFLQVADLREAFEKEVEANNGAPLPAAADDGNNGLTGSPPQQGVALDSPALSLLSFFHEDMSGEPLSDYLRARLTKEEYAWWVSLVLSHRAGSSSLLPMIDKLNHSPLPNCHYTMATDESVCGLDVLDNLLAGVPEELLYQPYVHLFAIRDIQAGEELTLCYTSAAEGAYRPAGTHPPPRPASLPASSSVVRQTNGCGQCSSGTGDASMPDAPAAAEMGDVMESLFPHPTTATVTAPKASIGGSAGGGTDDAALLRELQHLQHPGRQEVHTAEGRATWRLQWGFVPPCDAVYSARDLMEVAALVAERRVDTRAALFPPTTPHLRDSS
jgi:hypothetical protein